MTYAAPCCDRGIHSWTDADAGRCEECLVMDIEEMRKVGRQHQAFLDLTDEQYDGCTREQKLSVYFQHRPANVVPFVLELLERTHPEPEDPTDDATDTA